MMMGAANDGWVTIDSREAYGSIDSWQEYLCARRGAWGFILDVFRHEWLGEVPHDWYDEDGELLPEHQDEDGDLKLPEKVMGVPVFGYAYGGFIGELVSINIDGVQISDWSDEMVGAALEALRWEGTSLAEVRNALQGL
jgi:hypothetical protein